MRWRLEHPDKMREYNILYKDKRDEYRRSHKSKMKKYWKTYYDKNKKMLSEKKRLAYKKKHGEKK